jgi:hypothetical protein
MRCCNRHLGDNAHLTIVKNTGHAFNVERPKEFIKLLKSFLVDLQPPPGSPVSIQSKLQNTWLEIQNINAIWGLRATIKWWNGGTQNFWSSLTFFIACVLQWFSCYQPPTFTSLNIFSLDFYYLISPSCIFMYFQNVHPRARRIISCIQGKHVP